jgi:hypothetical protein
MVARDTLEVVRYLRSGNEKLRIGMNTNGSARNPAWWQEIAKVLDFCHFGIDGLADTNHLYRRQTCWETIMRNATAFIGAGGSATWEYIVFRHNEHQIDAARQQAQAMGFKRFRVRKTGRFFFGGKLQENLAVLNELGEEIYQLEPPTEASLKNSACAELGEMAGRSNGFQDYLDGTEIDCKAQREREIYVSAEGLLFPCCYLASFYRGSSKTTPSQFSKLLQQHGGKDSIDGMRRNIEEIVADTVFQTAVPDSWEKESVSAGRLAACSSACGASSATKGQYTSPLFG